MNGIIGFDGTLEGSVNAGGGGGTVPEIYADATVDNNTGTPAVTVTRTEIPGVSDTFHFAFQNLKGETGSAGSQGIQGIQGIPGPEGPQGPRGFTGQTGSAGPAGSDGYSPVVTIAAITGGNRVTITDETHPLGQSFDVMNGIDGSDGQTGPQGPQGNPGQGVPTGGTDGQILAKNGSSDYQTRWIDPIPDALPIISDEYDEHTAYSVGDYCIYENTLYKCNTDINPYEVWDPSHWDACTVGEEIAAANSEIDTINASLTQLFITKTYTYSYSNLAGYTGLSITESDFQGDTPTGYTPIAVSYFSTGTDTVIARTVRYSGNSWMNIYNTSSSARSSTATICILYAPTDFVTVS